MSGNGEASLSYRKWEPIKMGIRYIIISWPRSDCSMYPLKGNCKWVFGEGNGNLLQYSCLENPMDQGTWWAAVHGVTKSRTWLSDFTFTFHFHALEKEMASPSSMLAWRIPGAGAWWAAAYGVAQNRTWLTWLSSSSSSKYFPGSIGF